MLFQIFSVSTFSGNCHCWWLLILFNDQPKRQFYYYQRTNSLPAELYLTNIHLYGLKLIFLKLQFEDVIINFVDYSPVFSLLLQSKMHKNHVAFQRQIHRRNIIKIMQCRDMMPIYKMEIWLKTHLRAIFLSHDLSIFSCSLGWQIKNSHRISLTNSKRKSFIISVPMND